MPTSYRFPLLGFGLLVWLAVAPVALAGATSTDGEDGYGDTIAGSNGEETPGAAHGKWARLDRIEPSLAEIQTQSRRHAGLVGMPMTAVVRRARLSALLPDLTARATRGRAIDEDLSRASSGTEKLSTSIDYDLGLEVRATFRLSHLAYHPIELRADTQTLRRNRDRVSLDREVAALYYARRAAQLMPASSPQQRLARDLEVARLTAELDAYTGGWFHRELSAR